MKVIKHLKHETPDYRLKVFFKEMPLITRLLLLFITLMTVVLVALKASTQFTAYSYVDGRPMSQFLLLLLVALTDFQREERKGSIFFIISYVLKISLIAGVKLSAATLFLLFGIAESDASTSYPLLFCLMVAFRDMITKADEQRYLFIDPFAIKCLFYPLFLSLILEVIAIRIDILYALILGALLEAVKLDNGLMKISRVLDRRLLSEHAVNAGMLATGCSEIAMNQIDRVFTNNSIVLEEE